MEKQQSLPPLPVDPDAVLHGWRELLATGAHLHAPDVARTLRVSEAALVAARIGSGALRLIPDLPTILQPISDLGRVLCAFPNACGVHMPLGVVTAHSDAELLRLSGAHMSAEIDTAAIAEAFLFEDRDPDHGNTRSLQFFTETGEPVFKLFMFHKARFESAQDQIHSLVSPDQTRVPRPANTTPVFNPLIASLAEDRNIDESLGAEVPAAIAEFVAADERYEIEALGNHARIAWRGLLTGLRFERGMLHLHEPDLRSHLRLSPIAFVCRTALGGLSCESEIVGAQRLLTKRLLRFRLENLT